MRVYANPKVGSAFGLAAGEVIGRSITEFYGNPSGREARLAALEKDGYVRDNEIEMRKADGTLISTIHSLQMIEYQGEEAVLGGFYDITERKRLEEQLRQAQKMEAVGQLTGGVAHDFNNLLASILGHAEIVEEKLGGGDKSAKTIIRAAERGAQLTQRLLSFSRRQPMNSRSVDLRDLVGDVHQLLHRTLGETIDIDIAMAPSLWNAVTDPGQLENALLNLAINARDAMPDGGKLIIEAANVSLRTIDATSHKEMTPGDYVSLSVRDTGVGMPPEVMEHAFEPFFTTKDVGEGSGLGLSMVYGFTKQSGGNVTIESDPGHGTTVRLFLPRAKESVEPSEANDMPPPPRARGETVLVIEDDPDVRAMTEAILNRHSPYTIQIRGNRTAFPPPRELYPLCSHPMA